MASVGPQLAQGDNKHLRFCPECEFMCVARPLGRGNHFWQTLHWCIFDFFWHAALARSPAVMRGDARADSGGGVGLRGSPLLSPLLEAEIDPAVSSMDDRLEDCTDW